MKPARGRKLHVEILEYTYDFAKWLTPMNIKYTGLTPTQNSHSDEGGVYDTVMDGSWPHSRRDVDWHDWRLAYTEEAPSAMHWDLEAGVHVH